MYQTQGPSRAEIITNLTTCLRYKINDDVLLANIIDEIVPNNKDFGSYRGYYTFLHTQYKNQILEDIIIYAPNPWQVLNINFPI